MKKRMKQYIYSGIMTLVLMLTAVAVTVAWIESDISPEIRSQMKLASSPGLLMSFDDNVQDIIDINQFVLDEGGSIVLAEGSSAGGTFETLFIRYSKEPLTSVFAKKATAEDANKKFIYFTFSLTTANEAMDVWFDSSSYIQLVSPTSAAKSVNVIRVSLSLTSQDGTPITIGSTPSTTIFGTRQELTTATTDTHVTWAVSDVDQTTDRVVPYSELESAKKPLFYGRQDVHLFSEYTQANPWITLAKGQMVKVKMLVWLEGTDDDCIDTSTEQVSGSELGLYIKFNSGAHPAPATS